MSKRNIFACALVLCALFLSCSKDGGEYADAFVGRYKVEIMSQISDGGHNVSNTQPFQYTMEIDKVGDSLLVALDSVTRAIGYADAEGLHVERFTFEQRYAVRSSIEAELRTFDCTLHMVQFLMPFPLSNGTNQQSNFRATTVGKGVIYHTTNSNLELNDVIGTSVVRTTMLNDPNVIIERDTNTFPTI